VKLKGKKSKINGDCNIFTCRTHLCFKKKIGYQQNTHKLFEIGGKNKKNAMDSFVKELKIE
jgi:hypothetical protein